MAMSAKRALLLSLLELMRKPVAKGGLGLVPANCDVTSMGRPPAAAGPWFYGLCGSGSKSSITTSYMHEPRVEIVISARIAGVSDDRIGIGLIEAENGLDDRLGELQAWIARNQHVWMNAASAMLGTGVQPFHLPVFNMQESQPQEVGVEHWIAAPTSAGLRTQPGKSGVKASLSLSGFVREQYIETAT
jgi:hypothetical protein